ncbi:MAG: DoxX family protein [Candidatus Thiodiazotropha sp.]
MFSIGTIIHRSWSRLAELLVRLAPLADLAVRLYLAKVFFMSGLSKVTDWETTRYLFTYEYHVPLLPPEVAAVLGATGELALPVLLILGLFTRLSALGLFILNGVAVISYYSALQDSPAALQDHLQWGLMLAWLITQSAQGWTADRLLLARWARGSRAGIAEPGHERAG